MEVCRLLIWEGSDVSAADRGGKTPLHLASKEGHEDLLYLFIDKGANLSAADRNTPPYTSSQTPELIQDTSVIPHQRTHNVFVATEDSQAPPPSGFSPFKAKATTE
jgi:ankyrin repeat protein